MVVDLAEHLLVPLTTLVGMVVLVVEVVLVLVIPALGLEVLGILRQHLRPKVIMEVQE
jgi:hypothetical protein